MHGKYGITTWTKDTIIKELEEECGSQCIEPQHTLINRTSLWNSSRKHRTQIDEVVAPIYNFDNWLCGMKASKTKVLKA